MQATVVLGAGFSRNSGIPVQSQIPELLLNYKAENEFEMAVSSVLKQFVRDVFGYDGGQNYPSLDDMFTCIDISTNSGHHLGFAYTPMHLRAIRRLLVYRVFSLLDEMYKRNKEVGKLVKTLFDVYSQVNFVVLNWDTVLERYLQSLFPGVEIDYYNDGVPWQEQSSGGNLKTRIFKIHGSSNWLYCDNCRCLFYDMEHQVPLIRKAGFQSFDFELFPQLKCGTSYHKEKELCKFCENAVSSHIATFSFRKSFRANSFANVWSGAEQSLTESGQWIFIGYSLPDADYEFKHLLKISQMKFKHMESKERRIDVVLLNAEKTIRKYRNFFGESLAYICNEGVENYTKHLQKLL